MLSPKLVPVMSERAAALARPSAPLRTMSPSGPPRWIALEAPWPTAPEATPAPVELALEPRGDADPLAQRARDRPLRELRGGAAAGDAEPGEGAGDVEPLATPAVIVLIATAFQSNFDWMPVARPNAWLAVLATAPVAIAPRMPNLNTAGAMCGSAIATAAAIISIRICPIMPQPPLLRRAWGRSG